MRGDMIDICAFVIYNAIGAIFADARVMVYNITLSRWRRWSVIIISLDV